MLNYKDFKKGRPDFSKGVFSFRGGYSCPLSATPYAGAWEDYQVLSKNTNAVIIRNGYAIRWRKKGKPPEELPLHRFATKYKRQPLLGDEEEIANFLKNIELYIAQAIMESKRKKGGVFYKTDSGVEAGEAPAATL